jgi:hypothetical protein
LDPRVTEHKAVEITNLYGHRVDVETRNGAVVTWLASTGLIYSRKSYEEWLRNGRWTETDDDDRRTD